MRRPVAKDNVAIPVIIYMNGTELKECSSIQEAGKWLQQHTKHPYRRFTQVYDGIIHGDSWSYKGATYSFTTDEGIQRAKLQALAAKKTRI